MAKFMVITLKESEHWDSTVRSFANYDVSYLSGYAKAFQIHGDGEPLLIYFNDGCTKAMNVIMKRDIAVVATFKNKLPVNTWFDLSTPYGYGGFWVDGENYEAVNEAYENFCRDQGFVSEFVRFHLFSGYQPHYYGDIKTYSHNVVRSLDMSLDEMLMDFEHKVRKNLRKASAAGLEIKLDPTGAELDVFLDVYHDTMKRTGASQSYYFSRQFFEIINQMKGNFMYVHAISGGQVVSTELVLYGSENCYSFLGGTRQDFFDLRPNEFLKYEIIKWAKSMRLKQFILGGGHGEDDGIFRYKKSLAPNGVYNFYVGQKIFDQNTYEALVEARAKDADFDKHRSFFPAYRS